MSLPCNDVRFEFVSSIQQINSIEWNSIAAALSPFLSHEFLSALEMSGSVSIDAGWQPDHLLIYQNSNLVGMLPMYRKTHSYGEYVFDFSWANAYHQYGMNYYPKLVVGIPFTPVVGPRLLLKHELQESTWLPSVTKALEAHAKTHSLSSIHWLFPTPDSSEALHSIGHDMRQSVQFHWRNNAYKSFEDFMQRFSSRKRKNVKKERNKITQSGLKVRRLTDNELDLQTLETFYLCYQQTYLKRSGHTGYLNKAFFQQIFETMQDKLMLVVANNGQRDIASALFIYNQGQLCGRYWGCLQEVDGLHFECCYYQGIEFCIERGIDLFNPGTQGEHKIARGFEPTYCYSNHWMADDRFQNAIKNFCQQEQAHIKQYHQDACSLLPFKQT